MARRHAAARARLATMAAGLVLGLACAGAQAADRSSRPMPEVTPGMLEEGQVVYFRRCRFCHGLLGDGEGPAAEFLDPRPRDFTLGTFKFRTTQSGELPTNEDLFRTISRGLSGTAMQPFDDERIKNGLSEDQRWQVIAYIRTFAPEFDDPEFDPVKGAKVVSLPAQRPPFSEALAAKGKAVFEKAKCWECHGKQGRGDGLKAFDRKDDWGFPIRIRNVTIPWKIKAGVTPEDIFMRFTTGINGTPMPSFVKALGEEERWQLANYIKSLQYQVDERQVLGVGAVETLPESPDDAAWEAAPAMDVRLSGQVVVAPRWQNPSVELVAVRALHDGTDIAFHLTWDDPFADTVHDAGAEFATGDIRKVGAYNSYVGANGVVARKLETFRDAITLQFPIKPPLGTKKPHFLRGTGSEPVQLWTWMADRAEGGQAEESVARGWRQAPRIDSAERQVVQARSRWKEGQWKVVLRRPLRTEDRNDVQFVKGRFIPLALNAWDGSNGEHGLIMSLSTWRYVFLEAPTPISVYVYALLAVLVAGGLGRWLVRKAAQEEGTA
jgi:mono/diheme cytochrome c family protein